MVCTSSYHSELTMYSRFSHCDCHIFTYVHSYIIICSPLKMYVVHLYNRISHDFGICEKMNISAHHLFRILVCLDSQSSLTTGWLDMWIPLYFVYSTKGCLLTKLLAEVQVHNACSKFKTELNTARANPPLLYLNEFGMAWSMMYMSFEKRLRMRPRGVVSKNDMGERRMFFSMLSWRLREARMPPSAKTMEPNKRKRA